MEKNGKEKLNLELEKRFTVDTTEEGESQKVISKYNCKGDNI